MHALCTNHEPCGITLLTLCVPVYANLSEESVLVQDGVLAYRESYMDIRIIHSAMGRRPRCRQSQSQRR